MPITWAARFYGRTEWASFFFGSMCLPPDPALVGDDWRAMWLERLENTPLFFERWLEHQRRDAYWKHGSVCEDYEAIQCPVYAVGGWTDAYKNAIPRLLERLTVPRKGLIGPWAHAYPHFALPGPQIGFLQDMLRWWDHWLKGRDTGVMEEPMLRAWMMDSVKPAAYHEALPGRWVAESSWPSPGITPRRLFLTDEGLRDSAAPLTERAVCSPKTVGTTSGNWVPFGRAHDQAADQREDDLRSLVFETCRSIGRSGFWRGRRHPRRHLRSADGEYGGSAMRCASDRRIPARELWRAEPCPSRRPRRACLAGDRRALSHTHPTQ